MIEVFGEFVFVVKTFSIFKFISLPIEKLWNVIQRLLLGADYHTQKQIKGKDFATTSTPFDVTDYSSFQKQSTRPKRSIPFFLMMVALSCIGLPALLIKLWNIFKNRRLSLEPLHSTQTSYKDFPQLPQTIQYKQPEHKPQQSYKEKSLESVWQNQSSGSSTPYNNHFNG
jgi:hypothetical protein